MPDFPGTPNVEVLDGPDKPFVKPFDKPFDPVHDRKRKRGGLMEEEINVFCSMTDAVKELATAIRDCKPPDVHPDLYGAVMTQGGFSDEALMAALSHLLDKVLGSLPWQMLTGCCGSGAGGASTTTRVVLPVSVHDPRRQWRWWWRR